MSYAVKRAEMTAPASSPPTTATVFDFVCLFTHDLKRKQKRWQDGRLKYHTFNRRIMVHDDRGNFVGDAHWAPGRDLEEGEELRLDRGSAIVQVADCTGEREQDLTELLDKRAREVEKRREIAAKRTPASSAGPRLHSQLLHKTLTTVVGTPKTIGRAVVPGHSPYEARMAEQAKAAGEQHAEAPPAKRRKRSVSPPAKAGHARSLFGAALSLSGGRTPSSSARALRDTTNLLMQTGNGDNARNSQAKQMEPRRAAKDRGLTTDVDQLANARKSPDVEIVSPANTKRVVPTKNKTRELGPDATTTAQRTTQPRKKQAEVDDEVTIVRSRQATRPESKNGADSAVHQPKQTTQPRENLREDDDEVVLVQPKHAVRTQSKIEDDPAIRQSKQSTHTQTKGDDPGTVTQSQQMGRKPTRDNVPDAAPQFQTAARKSPGRHEGRVGTTQVQKQTRSPTLTKTDDDPDVRRACRQVTGSSDTRNAPETETRLEQIIPSTPPRDATVHGIDSNTRGQISPSVDDTSPILAASDPESDQGVDEAVPTGKRGGSRVSVSPDVHSKSRDASTTRRPTVKASTETQHSAASVSQDQPRTELRIRARRKRGLLMMSEKRHVSQASGHALQHVPGAKPGVVSHHNSEHSDTEDCQPAAPNRQNSREGQSERSPNKEGRQGPERDAAKSNQRSVSRECLSHSSTDHTGLHESSESDAPPPKRKQRKTANQAEEKKPAGPRISRMARKSVKCKEVFGFKAPGADDLVPAAMALATGRLGATNASSAVGNAVTSSKQPAHVETHPLPGEPEDATNKRAAAPVGIHDKHSPDASRHEVHEQAAATVTEVERKQSLDNSKRLTNPASRGKKAARKEHAAGQPPQAIVPLDPAPMGSRVTPRTESVRNDTRQLLPGFSSAGGGAWSRHAEDLLGSCRPEKRGRR